MRYTTIIDLREYPDLYRNLNVRLVYVHLVLGAGYHDEDRDQVTTSIRRLAYDCKITLSAARNALVQLQKAGLLRAEDGKYIVTKWTPQKPITARAKTQDEQERREAAALAAEARRKKEEKEEESQRKAHAFQDYLQRNNLTPQEYTQIETREKARLGNKPSIAICESRGWSYDSDHDRAAIYRDIQLDKMRRGNKAAAAICESRGWAAAAGA